MLDVKLSLDSALALVRERVAGDGETWIEAVRALKLVDQLDPEDVRSLAELALAKQAQSLNRHQRGSNQAVDRSAAQAVAAVVVDRVAAVLVSSRQAADGSMKRVIDFLVEDHEFGATHAEAQVEGWGQWRDFHLKAIRALTEARRPTIEKLKAAERGFLADCFK